MNVLPTYSRLSTWLDRWTGRWNRKSNIRNRADILEFVLEWSSSRTEEDGDGPYDFFNRVGNTAELGPDGWNPGFQGHIQKLHFTNYILRSLKEKKSEEHTPSKNPSNQDKEIEVLQNKRLKQMESLDLKAADWYAEAMNDESLPVHGKSPGVIMDRLSTLSLVLYHHQENSSGTNEQDILRRRNALGRELDALRKELGAGQTRYEYHGRHRTNNQSDPFTAVRG